MIPFPPQSASTPRRSERDRPLPFFPSLPEVSVSAKAEAEERRRYSRRGKFLP